MTASKFKEELKATLITTCQIIMAFLPKAGEKKCAMLKRHSAHVIDADEACHCQSKKMIGNS